MREGAEVVVLSDKQEGGLGAGDAFIPPLVAVGAVHHHLIKAGVRLEASIVVETAQLWSTHHVACLVGFGASAVHPYLLHAAIRHSYESDKRTKMRASGQLNDISLEQATRRAPAAPAPLSTRSARPKRRRLLSRARARSPVSPTPALASC